MAKVALPAEAPAAGDAVGLPGRFARVGRLLVDPSFVVAVELADDGGGVLHLSGGQAVELPIESAAGVLKRLGISTPKRRPRAKAAAQKARAVGFLPAIADLFSRAS